METAAIPDRQIELDLFIHELFGPDREQANGVKCTIPLEPLDLDDEEILTRAANADNGAKFSKLSAGNWKGDYSSQSEADLAYCGTLAFWFGQDKERMDRVFRQSGLYRDKWDREDYRNGTLDKAIAECKEVYKPAKVKPEPCDGEPPLIDWEPEYSKGLPAQNFSSVLTKGKPNKLNLPPMPEVITAAALQKKQFREPEFIVDGVIPEGTSLFTGKAKVGKSFAMADIALACACGGKAFGKIAVCKFGVLYLCLEDQERRGLPANAYLSDL